MNKKLALEACKTIFGTWKSKKVKVKRCVETAMKSHSEYRRLRLIAKKLKSMY